MKKQKNIEKSGKTFQGKVLSTKNTKTAVIISNFRRPHSLYKKIVKHRKKYYAHNELGAQVGDIVSIKETRPLSRLKRFIVISIDRHHDPA